MKFRKWASVALIAFTATACTNCTPSVEGIDETITLDQAKTRAQTIEREIADALPADTLRDIDQRATGTFLPCSGGEGDQWAGGLTAKVVGDPPSDQIVGPITDHFADRDDVALRLRKDHGDSLVDIIGTHGSMWIVRYARNRAELDVDSFAPCIRLPESVWRGDRY